MLYKKKIVICLFALIVSMFSVNAQNKVITVSGKVLDNKDKTAIVQAGLQLVHMPDSTYAAGSVTNVTGNFTLPKVKEGSYVLKVTYVGYQTKRIPLKLSASRANYNIGDIRLSPDAILLKEAVVTAQAPPVTVKGDTIEYAASAYRVPEGSMLEDLIKKIPGVQIAADGTITHNGKSIKKILVDGKEFFSDDPSVAMKNLPSNMVEKVKAYDKKSDMSKYTGIDDGDDESVLDLSVKKGMKDGWISNFINGYGSQKRYEFQAMASKFKDNGSITAIGSANNTNSRGFSEFGDAGAGGNSDSGSGITASKQLGLNVANETSKLRLEGNVSYGHSNNDAKRKVSSQTLLGQSSTYSNGNSSSLRSRDDARLDFHIVWSPDTLTHIVFMPIISHSHTNSTGDSFSQTASESDFSSLINSKNGQTYSKNHNLSLSGRFMLFRKLNSKGRNFMIGATLGYNNTDADNDAFSSTNFVVKDSTSVINRYTAKNSDVGNWGLSASYTEPIFYRHYLEFRYNFSHQRSKSESDVYLNLGKYLDHSNIEYSDSLSSKLMNYYNTQSFTLSLRGLYPKMMYSAGLSLTPQDSKSVTEVPTTRAKTLNQHVWNYAPSVMFRYMFNKRHFLMFRYNGRSSAPNVTDLQEVIDITDPLNLHYGNPDLKPSFTNQFMLFYNVYMPKTQTSINANLFYNNTINDVTDKMTYNTATGGRIYNRTNINGNWSTRGFLSFNTPLKNQKFTISSNTGATYTNAVSYTTINTSPDAVLSTTRNIVASQRLTGSFRTNAFDISLNGGIGYNFTRNNKQSNNNGNGETYDYNAGASTNINLPWSIALSTDMNCNFKEGYTGGLNRNEYIWNAQISKNFLSNAATIRFKIYDILHQQTNLTRSISQTMVSDTEYNTLRSYFMFHFVYRLNTIGSMGSHNRHGGFGGRRGGFGGGFGGGGFGGGFGGGRPH